MSEEKQGIEVIGDSLFPNLIDWSKCVPKFNEGAMNPYFWNKVLDLAAIAGGFQLNSAFRTPAWEYARHRSGTSQHCKGLAVDIACKSNAQRYNIVSAAIKLDFHRILIYPTFIHLDDKEQGSKREILWMNVS